MLTQVQKIDKGYSVLIGNAAAADARIKKIGKIFFLMATVYQHGPRIKMAALMECMAAMKVENAGGKTVEEILASSGESLYSKRGLSALTCVAQSRQPSAMRGRCTR